MSLMITENNAFLAFCTKSMDKDTWLNVFHGDMYDCYLDNHCFTVGFADMQLFIKYLYDSNDPHLNRAYDDIYNHEKPCIDDGLAWYLIEKLAPKYFFDKEHANAPHYDLPSIETVSEIGKTIQRVKYAMRCGRPIEYSYKRHIIDRHLLEVICDGDEDKIARRLKNPPIIDVEYKIDMYKGTFTIYLHDIEQEYDTKIENIDDIDIDAVWNSMRLKHHYIEETFILKHKLLY